MNFSVCYYAASITLPLAARRDETFPSLRRISTSYQEIRMDWVNLFFKFNGSLTFYFTSFRGNLNGLNIRQWKTSLYLYFTNICMNMMRLVNFSLFTADGVKKLLFYDFYELSFPSPFGHKNKHSYIYV